jgi:trimeric autotransporter adhesin
METEERAWYSDNDARLYFWKEGEKMKTRIMVKGILLGAVLFWLMLPWVGYSAVPGTINYQGYLTDSAGTPINATVSIVFSLYDTASAVTPLWSETQNVVVASGVYNVNLGAVNPIALPFDAQYFLGVKVGADLEMTPRIPLTSVGYAFRAEVANTVFGSGTFSNPIVSTVTTGTAPLQVTSTTNVTNLNADLLDGNHARDFATASQITNLQTQINSLQTQVSSLQTQVSNLVNLLTHFTRSGNDVFITGANLHVRSGSGSTNGTVNGLGNVIIGYNELRGTGDDRTGSHNLSVGTRNNFSSYGGIVVGYSNTISGTYATVTGGLGNTADGNQASVSGGYSNMATGAYASVSGGSANTAGGFYSSVSGGENNSVTNSWASVSGGRYNVASARWSHVSGGGGGSATVGNEAYSEYSAILGGVENKTGDPASGDQTIGRWATVSGGSKGKAMADWASVGGGILNTASQSWSAVHGGYGNTASGPYSTVSGGYMNTASTSYATVSGGYMNTADTTYATVSGALPQYDSGWVAIAQSSQIWLTHNLGGDPDDYIVDLQFYAPSARHVKGYGSYWDFDEKNHGAYWYGLSSTEISVVRGQDDTQVFEVRVRIWVNKKP